MNKSLSGSLVKVVSKFSTENSVVHQKYFEFSIVVNQEFLETVRKHMSVSFLGSVSYSYQRLVRSELSSYSGIDTSWSSPRLTKILKVFAFVSGELFGSLLYFSDFSKWGYCHCYWFILFNFRIWIFFYQSHINE